MREALGYSMSADRLEISCMGGTRYNFNKENIEYIKLSRKVVAPYQSEEEQFEDVINVSTVGSNIEFFGSIVKDIYESYFR